VDTETDVTGIDADYRARCAEDSDISLHLPFLYENAQGRTVIELGVRSGNSTAAFLAAGAEVWSADTQEPQVPGEWRGNPRWHFLLGDDLSPEILAGLPAKADIVFIDTAHTYGHTLAELRAYAPRARLLVLLHDTQWMNGIDAGTPSGEVARALDDYCAEAGLRWENRPGSYGMGCIRA
jgi:cephalosporin hydroxylase